MRRISQVITPLLIFFVAGSLLASQAMADVKSDDNPKRVYYLGTNAHPLVNAWAADNFDVVIEDLNLDGHENLERQLTINLPSNIDAALVEANRRLQAMPINGIQNAFKATTIALRFNIQKAPAFVFNNGQSVIYGITDAEEALKRWSFYQSRGGSSR